MKNTSSTAKWKNTRNRFVAFLDIMGFKDMVMRKSHDSVLKTIETFQKESIHYIESEAKKLMKTGKGSKRPQITDFAVKPVFFSDSILLFSEDSSFYSARKIIFCVQWLFHKALEINPPIPLKGAIAYGMQTANPKNSIYLGKPLIDAYELGNELLLYGAILHHTAQQQLSKNGLTPANFNWISENLIPCKGGNANHWIVVPFKESIVKLDKSLTRFYETVSGSRRIYVDNTIEIARLWKTITPPKKT